MLYPGIELSYNYFLGDRFRFHHRHKDCVPLHRPLLPWTHRLGDERRAEPVFRKRGPGLPRHGQNARTPSSHLPLGYYEGLTVSLDLSVLRTTLPELLRDAELDVLRPVPILLRRKRDCRPACQPADQTHFSQRYMIYRKRCAAPTSG